MRLITRLLVLLPLAACASKTAPPAASPRPQPPIAAGVTSCQEVTSHLIALTKTSQEMVEAKEDARARAEAALVGVADDYVKRCEATPWTAEQRQCALAAQTLPQLEPCEIERAAAEKGTKIRATTTDTGIPECDEYLVLLRRLASCDRLTDDARRARGEHLAQMEAELAWLRDPDAPQHAKPPVVKACAQARDEAARSEVAAACPVRSAASR